MGIFGGGGGGFFGGGGGGFGGGGGGLFGGGGRFGGGGNACAPQPMNCSPRPMNCAPPRQSFQPRPPGQGFLPRLGDGMRTLGPPLVGIATGITSMMAPPPAMPEMPMSYPPPAVASTQFPPMFPTSPEGDLDAAIPLSSTSLSAVDPEATRSSEDDEAELLALVEGILDEAREEREKDKDSDDILEEGETKLADAGGVSTEDELEDA